MDSNSRPHDGERRLFHRAMATNFAQRAIRIFVNCVAIIYLCFKHFPAFWMIIDFLKAFHWFRVTAANSNQGYLYDILSTPNQCHR